MNKRTEFAALIALLDDRWPRRPDEGPAAEGYVAELLEAIGGKDFSLARPVVERLCANNMRRPAASSVVSAILNSERPVNEERHDKLEGEVRDDRLAFMLGARQRLIERYPEVLGK